MASTGKNNEDTGQGRPVSDDEKMKEAIAEAFSSFGITKIQWVNEDGTIAHELDIEEKNG